ncbi:hypothetical protein BG003_002949 [Podila horticola]|nr:hypothetical protein BG003_002949 [Podila horticola]
MPRPQSYFKSTVQYSSAIALGQTIYILSVFLSLAQFAVTHAQVLMLAAQEQNLLTENTTSSETPSSQGTAVTDTSTAVTPLISQEWYSSRIKRALVKTLSGNFAPATLKRVTFDDEPMVDNRNEDKYQQHRPTRISEEDTSFATSPTTASPPTSPTGPGTSVRKGGLAHQQKSPQPLTRFDQIQRTQPKIERANATTTTTTTKKPSLPIFSLSSKSTTPSIAGGLRGINAFGSLGVAPETKSTNTTMTSIAQKSDTEERGLRRSTSAPSKNSPALRKNMESREKVVQTAVQTEENFIQKEEAPVEVTDKMTFSFFVTETVPDVTISPHSSILAPVSRPATPSLPNTTPIEVKTNQIEPPMSMNSLSVTSLGTRARRSLSLVRNRPSSILGDDDRKEFEEKNRRRSVQLDFPPDFLAAPNSGGSAMERQGSVGKSAGKGFLYKIAHPQRYKREQQEELQLKRSVPPSPLINEIQQPREQVSTKEAIMVDDSSSIRSLPSTSAPPDPAPQQQPRPSTPQPATVFPSWPEYVDHLDSSETVHSALYFPLARPAAHTADSSMTAMMPPQPPPSTRSSLLRRSRIFMDKPEDDDHTSFAAFGHPTATSTLSSDTSSVRPLFFARSPSASSEVSTPATTPSSSPRPSLSLNGSRPMSSGSVSGKNPASFGIAAALAGATGVSAAMAGVARTDDMSSGGRGFNGDDSASEYSVASSMQSADSEGRGRSGFVKKLGLKK